MRYPLSASFDHQESKLELRFLTAMVVSIAVLGGGSNLFPAPRFAAVIIAMGVLGYISTRSRWPSRLTIGDGLALALIVLPLVQLIPLPPAIWSALPGRSLAAEIDQTVLGSLQWRPLSLDPSLTAVTIVQLLPALTLYLAVRSGSSSRLRAVLDGLLIAGCVGISMGVLQLLFPHAAILQPYPLGDYSAPTGFFTNHNHQAVFIACLLPLAMARQRLAPWPWRHLPVSAQKAIMLALMGTGTVVILATGSRAGVALLFVTVLFTVVVARREWKITAKGVVGMVAMIAALGAMGGTRLAASLERTSIATDQRWNFNPDVWHASGAYWPAGAGLGTFAVAFAPHEPLEHASPRYLNHAHNDYLEIALEAGLPGVILIGLTFVWLLLAVIRAQISPIGENVFNLNIFLITPLIILMAHSIIDYPNRTIAMQIIFAICAAEISCPGRSPSIIVRGKIQKLHRKIGD